MDDHKCNKRDLSATVCPVHSRFPANHRNKSLWGGVITCENGSTTKPLKTGMQSCFSQTSLLMSLNTFIFVQKLH